MLPWSLLGSADVPNDSEQLRLYRRGEEFSIRVGAYELMNSRVHASEDALAELVCARLTKRDSARVLIGGLGMGFTLAAMLRGVGARAEVTVAELVPEVVEWNRGVLAHVAGSPLEDGRTKVHVGDVADTIRAKQWDAIVLDVDNGPAALTSSGNDRLYSAAGLRAAYDALRPGGVFAVWSGAQDAAFTARLQRTGFAVEELPVRGHKGGRGPRYVIWIGRRK